MPRREELGDFGEVLRRLHSFQKRQTRARQILHLICNRILETEPDDRGVRQQT